MTLQKFKINYKTITSAQYKKFFLLTQAIYTKKQKFICKFIQIIYFLQNVPILERFFRYKCYNMLKPFVDFSTKTIKYFQRSNEYG